MSEFVQGRLFDNSSVIKNGSFGQEGQYDLTSTLTALQDYELAMSKDISPYSLFSRNAIEHLVWAFGEASLPPVHRANGSYGRFFGAVVDYYAIYTDIAQSEEELAEMQMKPHYLQKHPLTYHRKKIHHPKDLEPDDEIALIHGRFEGGFPHPEHIHAIEQLVDLKKDNPRLKVMVGVDAGFASEGGRLGEALVSPLFSCSTIAQMNGVDYVCEVLGPHDMHWRTEIATRAPVTREYHQTDWNRFYADFYRRFNVKYLHMRADSGNTFFAEQLERTQNLGITPIFVERNGLPFSDSILRKKRRRYEVDQDTGYYGYRDFDEEAEVMAATIVGRLIPDLVRRKEQGFMTAFV